MRYQADITYLDEGPDERGRRRFLLDWNHEGGGRGQEFFSIPENYLNQCAAGVATFPDLWEVAWSREVVGNCECPLTEQEVLRVFHGLRPVGTPDENLEALRVALVEACQVAWEREAVARGQELSIPLDTPEGRAQAAKVLGLVLGFEPPASEGEAGSYTVAGITRAALPPEELQPRTCVVGFDPAGPDEEPGGSTVSLDFQVRAEIQLRPCVLEFARVMERRLRENDWKGGWSELRPFELIGRLEQAVDELRRAMAREAPANIFGQAVNVANYAMMVADLARGGTLGQQAAGEAPGVSHLLEDLRALAGSMGAACAEYSRAGSRAGLEHRVEEATIQCAMETVAGSCERAVRALIDKYGGRD